MGGGDGEGRFPGAVALGWLSAERAGDFHKNFGMRIDHLLVTAALAERVVRSEIDRVARKGKPAPSDHAPVIVDLDEAGTPLDAGWSGAEERIAARRRPTSRRGA
jgi:exodeoxyribonuclease-3